MKRRIGKISILVLILSFVFIIYNNNKVSARDLDRITNYEITVDPSFDDGSLDIQIDLTWKVLDSNYEGPLDWIKVGVPNWHVDNIKALTSNISGIKYYHDDGSFIRIDLDRSYYADEVLNIKFSFNQSYMYHLAGDEIYYDYNPGYFNDILVDNCTLRWKASNVKLINNMEFGIVDGYYTYSSPLRYGEYININLKYDKGLFTTIDPNKTYTNESDPYWWVPIVIFVSAFGVIAIGAVVYKYFIKDPYLSERGFYATTGSHFFMPYGRRYRNGGVSGKGKPINPPKSVGHSGGGGCACACACAGGGRAGCSMKDFYHTNLKSEKIEEVLKRDEL